MDVLKCREAFVKIIKDEDFYGNGSHTSLRQHSAGKIHGFHDQSLQNRWADFKRGWEAALKIIKEK